MDKEARRSPEQQSGQNPVTEFQANFVAALPIAGSDKYAERIKATGGFGDVPKPFVKAVREFKIAQELMARQNGGNPNGSFGPRG